MYEKYMLLKPDEKLNFFFEHISPTNRTPDYYVNWNKVERNSQNIEVELNTMNYLIGKQNIKLEARNLFLQYPSLLKTIPVLIASRDIQLKILTLDETNAMRYTKLDFHEIDINRIDEYLQFIEKCGLLHFLQNIAKRSLVDYVYGVEVGLDSNARKNRSGTTMESIVEMKISQIASRLNIEYFTQITAKKIYERWGISIPVDKSERRFDAAIFNHTNQKITLVETNYYGGGGSKLKSVCGEFRSLNRLLESSQDKINFAWITDGVGWNTAKIPLMESFMEIDNIFNLKMIDDGYLEQLIKK